MPVPNDRLAVEGSIETSPPVDPRPASTAACKGPRAEEGLPSTTVDVPTCVRLPRRANHAGPARQDKTAETTNEGAVSVGVRQQPALI